MKLTVTRPFLLAGVRQEIGAEIDIDDRGLVALLQSTGKAVAAELIDQRGPMTTETTAGVVSGARRAARTKGESNE